MLIESVVFLVILFRITFCKVKPYHFQFISNHYKKLSKTIAQVPYHALEEKGIPYSEHEINGSLRNYKVHPIILRWLCGKHLCYLYSVEFDHEAGVPVMPESFEQNDESTCNEKEDNDVYSTPAAVPGDNKGKSARLTRNSTPTVNPTVTPVRTPRRNSAKASLGGTDNLNKARSQLTGSSQQVGTPEPITSKPERVLTPKPITPQPQRVLTPKAATPQAQRVVTPKAQQSHPRQAASSVSPPSNKQPREQQISDPTSKNGMK